MNRLNRNFRHALLLALLAQPARAQVNTIESAWLEWTDLQIAISPDSSGTYLWVHAAGKMTGGRGERFFTGQFLPDDIAPWIGRGRAFVTATFSDDDSVSVRSTLGLVDRAEDAVYIARRKVRGKWTSERILTLERAGQEPLIISADEKTLGDILDSLEAVSRRTTLSVDAMRRDSLELAAEKMSRATPPRGLPQNRAPAYPESERGKDNEGVVVLNFMVTAEGKPDMATVKVVHSPSPDFLHAVLEALEKHRFEPARRNGVAVPMRVIQPFAFAMRRFPGLRSAG
jgi:TonB family protein